MPMPIPSITWKPIICPALLDGEKRQKIPVPTVMKTHPTETVDLNRPNMVTKAPAPAALIVEERMVGRRSIDALRGV